MTQKMRIGCRQVGDDGWLVVARDKKMRTRPGERDAIIKHSVGMFMFVQSTNPTKWDYFKLMAKCLDEMERLFSVTPKPFIFLIDSSGAFRLFDLTRFQVSSAPDEIVQLESPSSDRV